ncbi:uncharacterized protein LOC141631307 [Silene latifolia]|uniref:uncharacterized protein LOC141631307 n=1 Tax=Silene latifolia TaxID=37657 RepID=UPI003D76C66D
MAKRKNPKPNNPKSINNQHSNRSNNNNNSHNTKSQKTVGTNIASSSGSSPSPVRRVSLNFPPLSNSELDVIVEEEKLSEDEIPDYEVEEGPGSDKEVTEPLLRLSTDDVEEETKEKQMEVVNTGHLMFDNKPVIVKEWKPETELIKHDVKSIPIWVKLYGLDIKFWGTSCLSKISGLVGKFLRCDEATSRRAFLGFARMLVEVQIGQEFSTEIEFLDELGVPVIVGKSPVVETQSLPRRFITKMLRQDSSEPRIFTPRGISLMDALTVSLLKARNVSNGKRVIQMVSDQLIHAQVFDKGNNKKFWVTMVYGFNKSQERISLWNNLQACEGLVQGPWIVCGDFNSVIDVNERIGGADVTWSEMAPMKEMMAQRQFGERKKTPFKYFNMWALDENFLEVVTEGWRVPVYGTPMYQVMQKLKSLKHGFKQLNRANFNDIENLTQVTELSLKHFQEKLRMDPFNPDLCQAERDCAEELSTLVKARGLYLAQKAKEHWMKEVHQAILTAPLTDEEIKQAMFSIPGNKAPGPDGYSSQFFKDSWSIVGKDVIRAVKSAFDPGKIGGHTPENINPAQSAFIQGRDIVGNILICQDLIKLYKRKTCSPKIMLIQKAYNSVEWEFLIGMLECLGFRVSLTNLIMECVSSTSYSLAVNGETFGYFQGKRGLRQGDPLSLLLFTICLEYLSRLLERIQRVKGFKYHPLCARVGFTHLCFADDLVVFCRGDMTSLTLVLRAIETFSRASGLKMNEGKSNMYGNGIPESFMDQIEQATGMKRGAIPFRYLGVNIIPKCLGIMDCQQLVDKVTKRIRAVGSKKLLYAGRLILIKTVLNTVHNYWSRIFIIPKAVLNKIDALCRAFLWHGNEAKESPALVAWNKLCKPRKNGGLGLRHLHSWNIAAIEKYVWWIEAKPDHLWVCWVHAIYIKQQVWQDFTPSLSSSWAWRKVCWVKNLLQLFLFNEQWRAHNPQYSIKIGYSWLVDEGNRLLTQDRMFKMKIIQENRCLLCGIDEESIEHLYFKCLFGRKCLALLSNWLQVDVPVNSVILGLREFF